MSHTKERPILMSGPNIQPLLENRKTKTRRIIKPQPQVTEQRLRETGGWVQGMTLSEQVNAAWQAGFVDVRCPYGQPGDALWVKETWRTLPDANSIRPRNLMNVEPYIHYEADSSNSAGMGKLRPSIFMPRWASRITLEITDVRVERLQDISEADAVAEGIDITQRVIKRDCVYGIYQCKLPDGKIHFDDSAYNLYRKLWESINGAGSWDANSWVWVISFRKIEG